MDTRSTTTALRSKSSIESKQMVALLTEELAPKIATSLVTFYKLNLLKSV